MDTREKSLPVWAKNIIDDLRRSVNYEVERNDKEIRILRQEACLLRARNAAMTELLECAAMGKHPTALEIMEILRSYSLALTPIEDKP